MRKLWVCDLLLKNNKDAAYCFVDDDKGLENIERSNYKRSKFSKPSKKFPILFWQFFK